MLLSFTENNKVIKESQLVSFNFIISN